MAINFTPSDPDEGTLYGPDMFYSDLTLPDPTTVINEPLPRAWSQGGVIESVKRAVVTGLRDGFYNSTLGLGSDTGEKFSIDIEYPTDPEKFPGVWVQFSISSIKSGGLGMETWVKDEDENWSVIQVRNFEGRITLTAAALTAKDRDRLADTIIAQLSFARPPDMVLRDKRKDTKQFKGMITALDNNPYVQMTVNTDMLLPGGQTVSSGTPWANNVLLYEDAYSVECVGQFNMRFSHDGTYSLAAIQANASMLANNVAYDPTQWQ